jgi:hypothetical protein
MVDALIRARRWLKPPLGRLIDLRPAHVVPHVEIKLADGTIAHVGGLVVDDERRQRHLAADLAVSTARGRGLLAVTGEEEFSFYRYPDSADDLRDYIAVKWQHTHLDAATYARAGEMIRANPGARLWLREQVGIRILRPAAPSQPAVLPEVCVKTSLPTDKNQNAAACHPQERARNAT